MVNFSKKRVLIVDDNPEIHKDFKLILTPAETPVADKTAQMLFGENHNLGSETIYELDTASQGEEAFGMVEKAIKEEQPYALAFVDIRMPPGWDGVQTVKKLWSIDKNIQVVICTAHSDYTWAEMFDKLDGSDNFLILKKPFEVIEIRQLASALSKKWELRRRITNQIENLEATVAERTLELRSAKEFAEMTNRVKSEFLRNLSKELRTPLYSIIGFVEILHSNNKNYFDKDYLATSNAYLRDILSSAKELSQMVSDMLDVAQLEFKDIQFNYAGVDLVNLLNDMEEMFRVEASKKNIKFSTKVDSQLTIITADLLRLKQIIFNYVSNAIKFTPTGGEVSVNIYSVPIDKFCIEVKDSGIGVKKEDIEKLFATFQPLDTSMSKRYPGIGLGLALTKRIVELQGGEVGCKSNYGEGSMFFAILPVNPGG